MNIINGNQNSFKKGFTKKFNIQRTTHQTKKSFNHQSAVIQGRKNVMAYKINALNRIEIIIFIFLIFKYNSRIIYILKNYQ